jgi:hypothetical protein
MGHRYHLDGSVFARVEHVLFKISSVRYHLRRFHNNYIIPLTPSYQLSLWDKHCSMHSKTLAHVVLLLPHVTAAVMYDDASSDLIYAMCPCG